MNETQIAGQMYESGYSAGWEKVFNGPAPRGYSKYMGDSNFRKGFSDGEAEAEIEMESQCFGDDFGDDYDV